MPTAQTQPHTTTTAQLSKHKRHFFPTPTNQSGRRVKCAALFDAPLTFCANMSLTTLFGTLSAAQVANEWLSGAMVASIHEAVQTALAAHFGPGLGQQKVDGTALLAGPRVVFGALLLAETDANGSVARKCLSRRC